MANHQLDEQETAGEYYQKAVTWMEEKAPEDDELSRFRAEAADLLGKDCEGPMPEPDSVDSNGKGND